MNMELSEDEQVDALKKWWKENGTAVIIGVVVGISAVVGVWQWREYTEMQALEASDIYVTFSEALADGDNDTIKKNYDQLSADYSGTSYAMLAAMHMAKREVDNGKLDAAENYLKWAIDNSGHESLKHVAIIRLAALFVAQEKYDQALPLLEKSPDKAFDAQYVEIKGDIFRHQGQLDAARKAYETALDSSAITGKRREFLQMKLGEVKGNSDVADSLQDKPQ